MKGIVSFTWKLLKELHNKNPKFDTIYPAALKAGLIRGPYHFARPNLFSGAHSGGWSADGKTLPGVLYVESGCYGLSPKKMVAWILDFSETYKDKTGRKPVIYTTEAWWKQCTGNSLDLQDSPLWIARYKASAGQLPQGWSNYTFWLGNMKTMVDKEIKISSTVLWRNWRNSHHDHNFPLWFWDP